MKKIFELKGNESQLIGSVALRKMKQYLGRLIIPCLPITPHVFNHIRWELRGIWVRANNKLNPIFIVRRRTITQGDNLSVNIGCGGSGKIGWVNLDLMNHANLSLRWDCRKTLPLRGESAIRIRCEHFLEHLDPYEEVPLFLKSCYKSLKEGGVLRIVVPDAEQFLRAYQSGKREDWIALGWDISNLPEGFHTQMDIINHVFRQCEEHVYAYDYETLEFVLRRAGLNKIQKYEFGVSFDSELCDDLPNHKPYSLYVEAIK